MDTSTAIVVLVFAACAFIYILKKLDEREAADEL